jgi:hypothetical protein
MLEELQERIEKDRERAKPAAAAAAKPGKTRGAGGSGRKAKPTARRRARTCALPLRQDPEFGATAVTCVTDLNHARLMGYSRDDDRGMAAPGPSTRLSLFLRILGYFLGIFRAIFGHRV